MTGLDLASPDAILSVALGLGAVLAGLVVGILAERWSRDG